MTTGPASSAPHQTLHARVTDILRDKIIDGVLRPGTPISEKELCLELDVSRTPLREALKVLASENLIHLYKNRGAVVAPISTETMGAKFALLAALEGFAAKLVCVHASDSELDILESLHEKLAGAFQRGDDRQYFKMNQDFHFKIIQLARNPVLADMHASLSKHVRRGRFEGVLSHLPSRETLAQHEKVLKAIKARDAEGARLAMEEHVNIVALAVSRHLSTI